MGNTFGGPPRSLSEVQSCTAVALEKQQYCAGETVRGYVQMQMASAQAMRTVAVQLQCTSRTRVHYTTHKKHRKHRRTHHHTAKEERTLFALRAPCAEFPYGSVAPGLYQFSFEFTLPSHAPASVHHEGRQNSFTVATTATALIAGIEGGGNQEWSLNPIVIDITSPPPPAQPLESTSTQPVNCFCCINRGEVSLTSAVSTSVFRSGDTGQVRVQVDNLSSTQVDQVCVTLWQEAHFSARGHNKYMSIMLGQTVLHPDGIAPHASAEQRLGNLQVAANALSSMQCENVRVSHHVDVEVHTGCCITNPTNEHPVVLTRAPLAPHEYVVMAQAIVDVVPLDADDDGGSGGDSSGVAPIFIAAAIPYTPGLAPTSTQPEPTTVLTSPAPVSGVGTPVDTTGDGWNNATGWDTTGDGALDAFDTNQDGNVDTVRDANGNFVAQQRP